MASFRSWSREISIRVKDRSNSLLWPADRLTAALPNGGLTAIAESKLWYFMDRLTAALPDGGLTAIAKSKLWYCGSTYSRTPKWRTNSDCRVKIVAVSSTASCPLWPAQTLVFLLEIQLEVWRELYREGLYPSTW